MDWKKLSEDYPKAMTHLGLTFECLYTIGSQRQGVCIKHCKKRDLYDFFDENEIDLEVGKTWYYIEYYNGTFSCYDLKDRSSTEASAFKAAFEILNNRL